MNGSLSFFRPALFLSAAASLFALVGCSEPASQSSSGGASNSSAPAAQANGDAKRESITVGFSQVGAESTWREAESRSIREEAEKRGVDLKFADGQGNQQNQFRALRGFIAQDVDAILLAPVVENGWEPVLREIKEAGIPVILVDRGVTADSELFETLIASDFVREGRMAAEFLAKELNGQGNIVELEGTPGAAPAIDRKKGFHEELAKHPGLKVIKSQTGDFNMAKGKEVMEAFLSAGGEEINAVYAHNDDMALGAIQAIEEAGKKPGDDILVVSIDGMKGAFEAMVEGKLNATVECSPLLGPYAFDAVEKALAGEELPKRVVVDDQIYDRSKAAEVIGERKY